MRNFLTLFLCVVFVSLCSCTNRQNSDVTTSTTNKPSTATIQQTETTTQTEYTTTAIKTSPDDPYSYIIKETYDHVIYNYENPKFTSLNDTYYYCLYDIDGNGSDELLLGEKYVIGGIQNVESGEPYEEGVTFFHIYTNLDGVAVEQDIRPWWCAETLIERSILSNGLLRASGRIKNPSYCYFDFIDGKLEYRESLSTTGDEYRHLYIKDGEKIEEKISKFEFDHLHAEIENGAKPIEINWKRIDEYGK